MPRGLRRWTLGLLITLATTHAQAAHVPVRIPSAAAAAISKLPLEQQAKVTSLLGAQSHPLHSLHAHSSTHALPSRHRAHAKNVAPVEPARVEATPRLLKFAPAVAASAPTAQAPAGTSALRQLVAPAKVTHTAAIRNERSEHTLFGGLVKIDDHVATTASGSIVNNEKKVTVGPLSFSAGRADKTRPANAKQQEWPIVDPGASP